MTACQSLLRKRELDREVRIKGIRKFSSIFFILLDFVCREMETLCIWEDLSVHKLRIMVHKSWWCRIFPSSALSLLIVSEKKRKWALGRVKKNSFYKTGFSLDGSGKHLSTHVV